MKSKRNIRSSKQREFQLNITENRKQSEDQAAYVSTEVYIHARKKRNQAQKTKR